MSFANQALSCEHLVKVGKKLKKQVYRVPESIDAAIADIKLASMGVKVDRLTKEQKRYLESWEMGT